MSQQNHVNNNRVPNHSRRINGRSHPHPTPNRQYRPKSANDINARRGNPSSHSISKSVSHRHIKDHRSRPRPQHLNNTSLSQRGCTRNQRKATIPTLPRISILSLEDEIKLASET